MDTLCVDIAGKPIPEEHNTPNTDAQSPRQDKTTDDCVYQQDIDLHSLPDKPTLEYRLARMDIILTSIVPTLRKEIRDMGTEQDRRYTTLSSNITEVETKVNVLQRENAQLRSTNDNLFDRMNSLEAYSRKNNILFHRVPEDNSPIMVTISKVIQIMGIDAIAIPFDAIHRTGISFNSQPRTIHARFTNRTDRDKVRAARRALNKSPYVISEDLPKAYQKARLTLKPVMAAAWANEKKAVFVKDKLKVDGHLYSVKDMKTLPVHLNPELGCVKESPETIAFFGKHTPLSNFYISPFKMDSIQYNCVEQYLQRCKAELMGNEEVAVQVMRESNPAKQKGMCAKPSGDIRKWHSKAEAVTYRAVHAKVQQNDDVAAYLRSTGIKQLVEASTDKNFGIGVNLSTRTVLQKETWTGHNWLGNVLMRVRNELK